MIPIFVILFATTTLAYFAASESVIVRRNKLGLARRFRLRKIDSALFYTLLGLLVLFVGLRSSYNDTGAYLLKFKNIDPSIEAFNRISWILAENPGFEISNILLKFLVGGNGNIIIFIYSLVSVTLLFIFYRRWSICLWVTVFLFCTTGMLLLTMAALKQVLAMSIGLCGITCFLANRRGWFVFCVLFASSFHVYILFYLLAFVLSDRLWSRKVILIILGAVISGVFIEQFIGLASVATEVIGAEYQKTGELSAQGVNFFRFLVSSVAPLLIWIYRARINESGNRALILCSNFTLIGWCFMFIALFRSANMFARMAMYFDPFMHLALTALVVSVTPRWYRQHVLRGCLLFYLLFFWFELYAKGFSYRWIL